MKIDFSQQKQELISLVLLGGAAVFALLIFVKATGFLVTLARADNIVGRAVAQSSGDAKDVDKALTKYQSLAQELKTNNLFAPPPPKEHPVKQVSGIFGDEALINGQWVKVGGSVGDAKVLAIGPASVTVTWNGTEKVFLPIDGGGSGTSQGPQSRRSASRSRGPSGPGRPGMVVSRSGNKTLPTGKSKVKVKKSKGQADWTRKMSVQDLHGVRRKIQDHIRGLREEGITDPAAYRGAREKMEVVEDAIRQREGSK